MRLPSRALGSLLVLGSFLLRHLGVEDDADAAPAARPGSSSRSSSSANSRESSVCSGDRCAFTTPELDEQVARAARTELRQAAPTQTQLVAALRGLPHLHLHLPVAAWAPSPRRRAGGSQPSSARVPRSFASALGAILRDVDVDVQRAAALSRAVTATRAALARTRRRCPSSTPGGRFTAASRAGATGFSRRAADPPTTSPERAPSAPRPP